MYGFFVKIWEIPTVSPIINYINGVVTVSILERFEDGRGVRALPHDFWVAPGSFDLESSTAFIEPCTPLIAVVVFELELFVAPDERGASLRPDRGLKTREQGS